MGYSASAGNIRNSASTLTTTSGQIENLSFSSVWAGGAYDNQMENLSQISSSMSSVVSQMETFSSGLDQLEVYKSKKEELENLQARLASLGNDKEYDAERSNLQSRISELTAELESMKSELIALFDGISGETTDITAPDTTIKVPDMDFALDAMELVNIYASGTLRQLQGGESLYSFYDQIDANGNRIKGTGREYVLNYIKQAGSKGKNGRERSVNSALALLKLASDKGVKLDYVTKGTVCTQPYVPTDEVATGVDCNPFTSWCVDKGTPGGFQWRPVGSFKQCGNPIPKQEWGRVQPGDVFVWSRPDATGHVGFIIANNPNTRQFICAEAKGQNVGIVISIKNYDELTAAGGREYQIQDMSAVYSGEENTNRSAFDQYVDWENFNRKP